LSVVRETKEGGPSFGGIGTLTWRYRRHVFRVPRRKKEMNGVGKEHCLGERVGEVDAGPTRRTKGALVTKRSNREGASQYRNEA